MGNSNKRPHPAAHSTNRDGRRVLSCPSVRPPAHLERSQHMGPRSISLFFLPLSGSLFPLFLFGAPLDGVTSTNRAHLLIPGPSLYSGLHTHQLHFGEARYSSARHGTIQHDRYLEKQKWPWPMADHPALLPEPHKTRWQNAVNTSRCEHGLSSA